MCGRDGLLARSIRFARSLDLPVAVVRGGGHSVAGMALGDGSVVVDLRHMRAVTVDPAAEAVRVAGGAIMSDLDRATQPHGLATTGGRRRRPVSAASSWAAAPAGCNGAGAGARPGLQAG
ncbi:hypothetical protein SALBM311S_01749 [Streptomyces alboniger]